jgi:hypothetical protein
MHREFRKDHGLPGASVIDMKDFTRQPRVIEFKIDQDVFRCHPRLPAQTMIDFTLEVEKIGDEMTSEQGIETMIGTLKMVLVPDSYKLFHGRMSNSDEPIELDQINEIIQWIMGEYGLRPTQSPEDSSTGASSPAPGMNSTGGSPAVESISLPSTPTAS